MDKLSYVCPQCKHTILVDVIYAGQPFKCPVCTHVSQAPAAPIEPEPGNDTIARTGQSIRRLNVRKRDIPELRRQLGYTLFAIAVPAFALLLFGLSFVPAIVFSFIFLIFSFLFFLAGLPWLQFHYERRTSKRVRSQRIAAGFLVLLLTGSAGLLLSLIVILPVWALSFSTSSDAVAEENKSVPMVNPAIAVSPNNFPGLIGYWSFDEKLETADAKDHTGRGNNGTLHGAFRWPGLKGNAMKFNGQSHVDYGKSPLFDFPAGSSFTFAGWVKTTRPGGTVVSQRHSRREGADIDLTVENGKLVITMRQDQGVLPATVRSKKAVDDSQWHHFAFMRHANGVIELFVDGISEGQDQSEHSSGPITTDLRALGSERYWVRRGQGGHGGARPYFDGWVDEFCIFNRALSVDEIEDLAGLE